MEFLFLILGGLIGVGSVFSYGKKYENLYLCESQKREEAQHATRLWKLSALAYQQRLKNIAYNDLKGSDPQLLKAS